MRSFGFVAMQNCFCRMDVRVYCYSSRLQVSLQRLRASAVFHSWYVSCEFKEENRLLANTEWAQPAIKNVAFTAVIRSMQLSGWRFRPPKDIDPLDLLAGLPKL